MNLPAALSAIVPRTAWFVERVACGPTEIKISAISTPDTEVRETDIARAEDMIRAEGAKLVHRSDHIRH